MNTRGEQTPRADEPSATAFAEAAAWIARMHGPNRTVQVDHGLRRWLQADPSHAAAFEAMSAGWEVTGKLPRGRFPQVGRWQRAGYREGFIRSAIAVAAVGALAVGLWFHFQQAAVVTTVGEQRILNLQDGTRVFVNTATRLTVDFDGRERRIELRSGEALFEVAKQPSRPFVVAVADKTITALGTSFVVRRDPDRLAVTLIDGKVAVASGGARDTVLEPGERLTFAAGHMPKLDEPAVEKVAAWRRGLLDFDNTPLADAVAEMNRYSETRLVVERPESAQVLLNGVFRTGDVSSFAAAVARAYRLEIIESKGQILLAGIPLPRTGKEIPR